MRAGVGVGVGMGVGETSWPGARDRCGLRSVSMHVQAKRLCCLLIFSFINLPNQWGGPGLKWTRCGCCSCGGGPLVQVEYELGLLCTVTLSVPLCGAAYPRSTGVRVPCL